MYFDKEFHCVCVVYRGLSLSCFVCRLRHAQRGDLTVILRDGGEGADGKPKQVLEVWRGGKLSDSRDALQSDKHGKIYADSTLGCMEVSPDGRLLVYIAEKKEAKKQSFLKLGLVPDSEGVKWVST